MSKVGVLSTIITLSLIALLSNGAEQVKERYSIVIDGGSSGSRIRVYQYQVDDNPNRLPNFKEVFSYKKEPGVSDCANDEELRKHILELLGQAKAKVPAGQHNTSPIYFMATAGMRMMLEHKANDATKFIDTLLLDKTSNPFRYVSPDNARILSGEEEGVFAWIAANYLRGVFNKYGQRDPNTLGILEMGGASTQIAWVPKGNILANKFPVRIAGATYSLYVHSYLSYGQEETDRWIRKHLHDENPSAKTVDNPCMISGSTSDPNDDGVTFSGTGNPSACVVLLDKLVYQVQDRWKCSPQPCAIGTNYQPTINPLKKFYAVGAFIHGIRAIEANIDDEHISLEDVNSKAYKFCKTPLNELAVKKKFSTTDKKQVHLLSKQCLTALYMPILVTKGFGFANDTTQIGVKLSPNSPEIEWPLGAVIYEYEKDRPTTGASKEAICSSSAPATIRILFLNSITPMFLIYGLVFPLLYWITFII